MLVSDYMSPDPIQVRDVDRVEQVAELMRRRSIHQVPVVDEAGRLVGIVTDRDVRSATGYECRNDLDLVAEDIMTSDVVTIAPGAALSEAVELLLRHRFRALPVVLGDRVVGMLSTSDLLRRLADLLEILRSESARTRGAGVSQSRRES